MQNVPEHPDTMVVLVTEDQTAFVLIGDTLAEIPEQLLPDLERSDRRPSDPPEVVEVGAPRSWTDLQGDSWGP